MLDCSGLDCDTSNRAMLALKAKRSISEGNELRLAALASLGKAVCLKSSVGRL